MSEIQKALALLQSSRDALRAELEADERWQQLTRLDNAIAALGGEARVAVEGTIVATGTVQTADRPSADTLEDRGTNPLILAILGEDPSRVWKVDHLLREMVVRKWDTDAANRRNALGTALLRLAKRGEIEKVGRGRYRAASQPAPDDTTHETGADELDPSAPQVDFFSTPHASASQVDYSSPPDESTAPSRAEESDVTR